MNDKEILQGMNDLHSMLDRTHAFLLESALENLRIGKQAVAESMIQNVIDNLKLSGK